jgi:hypothetical protein
MYWGVGKLLINETVNTKMSQGITINQAANDNEILAFKSTDVAHGYTDSTETDTFCFFRKNEPSYGGMTLVGHKMTGGTSCAVMIGGRFGGATDTTKSTLGRAVIEIYGTEMSGNNEAAIDADGNVFGVRARTQTGYEALFIVGEPGDTWQKGSLTLGSTALSEADLISLLALLV